MEVICLQSRALDLLITKVLDEAKERLDNLNKRWLNHEETMSLLNIKSKSTLQKLRDAGSIRFSQPERKIILYDRESIEQYLEANARETF
ncbi:helix-turn-helix domain-containing protein [Reichenbachiella ulvae]|uniref:Helix-turn-helix domain-containing protein n=1 Tax=Reichenbachiella ulvae TaxID=2980104 RepID=A0ABT3CNG3_9BACT|nr:helix-turn-helix domain-containing protein [Reichenbachiella ulvae]MCV9385280.1 helix-turn-helix domain-containing protein [Reichenbachiella ulvae]MCV9389309.1 helix-turn-helix domain-containing protein [Reichenbachiella ulvae]